MSNVPRDIYMRKPIAPCKGCEDREMKCHSSCVRYKGWTEECLRITIETRTARNKEQMVEDYEIKAKQRMKTSRRRRG